MNHPRFITTSRGVCIGCAYQPRPAPLTADQERIQASLLEPRTARPVTRIQRLLGALWSWL